MRIDGFSRNASDLFRVATMLAGFDARELMLEIHKRAPRFATERTVSQAMQAIADRFDSDQVTPAQRATCRKAKQAGIDRLARTIPR